MLKSYKKIISLTFIQLINLVSIWRELILLYFKKKKNSGTKLNKKDIYIGTKLRSRY